MAKTLTFILAVLFLSSQIQASVRTMTVIYDGGGASIQQYLEVVQSADQSDKTLNDIRPIHYDDPRLAMLPVATEELAIGRLPSPFIPKKLPGASYPVLLVGADETSYRWLHANQETFRSMGAVGIVVNVETLAQLKQLEAVSGIRMNPVNGADFATMWGIQNYPVLITAEGIHQ